MGYYLAIVPCYSCGQNFTCNPHLVPSVVVDGVREPVCLACIQQANPIRQQRGLEPIVPREGAYEAACEDDGFGDTMY